MGVPLKVQIITSQQVILIQESHLSLDLMSCSCLHDIALCNTLQRGPKLVLIWYSAVLPIITNTLLVAQVTS